MKYLIEILIVFFIFGIFSTVFSQDSIQVEISITNKNGAKKTVYKVINPEHQKSQIKLQKKITTISNWLIELNIDKKTKEEISDIISQFILHNDTRVTILDSIELELKIIDTPCNTQKELQYYTERREWGKIFWRSLLPGAGQVLRKSYIKGVGIFVAEIATFAFAIDQNNKRNDFLNKANAANNALNITPLVSNYNKAVDAENKRNAWFIGAGAIFVYNLIDNIIYTKTLDVHTNRPENYSNLGIHIEPKLENEGFMLNLVKLF